MLAEVRQRDRFTSLFMLAQYRQKRIREISSPLLYKHSRQILLKLLSERQDMKRKEV